MDRNQAKEFYPILQAYAEGRVIECRTKPSALSKSWRDLNDWTEMKDISFWDNIEYRIKPEQKFRPFKDAEECWQEMQNHQPFGWVKYKEDGRYTLITSVADSGIFLRGNASWGFSGIMTYFTFADNRVFGVKVEE